MKNFSFPLIISFTISLVVGLAIGCLHHRSSSSSSPQWALLAKKVVCFTEELELVRSSDKSGKETQNFAVIELIWKKNESTSAGNRYFYKPHWVGVYGASDVDLGRMDSSDELADVRENPDALMRFENHSWTERNASGESIFVPNRVSSGRFNKKAEAVGTRTQFHRKNVEEYEVEFYYQVDGAYHKSRISGCIYPSSEYPTVVDLGASDRSSSEPTKPPPSESIDDSEVLVLGVLSDLNGTFGSTTYAPTVDLAVDLLKAVKPDLVVTSGDMVAGQKTALTRDELKAMWNGFEQTVLTPILDASIPFAPGIGNHDASAASGFEREREVAFDFWNDRKDSLGVHFVEDTDFPYNYSILHESLYAMFWDASTSTTPSDATSSGGSLSIERIKSSEAFDLKSTLQFVIGHLPLYAVVGDKNTNGEIISRVEGATDEQTLVDAGFDLYISGHQHAYYPALGHFAQLPLLNMGLQGGGPRTFINGSRKASHSMSFVVANLAKQDFIYITVNLNTLSEEIISSVRQGGVEELAKTIVPIFDFPEEITDFRNYTSFRDDKRHATEPDQMKPLGREN